jgi:ATP-dependent DNA helicase 2 subunit 1
VSGRREIATDCSGNRVTGNKRVFLITDQDEPPGSEVNRSPARTVFTVS